MTRVSSTPLKGAEGTLAKVGAAAYANRDRRPNRILCRSLRPNKTFTKCTRPPVFSRTDLLHSTERLSTPTSKYMLSFAVSNVLTHFRRVRRDSTKSGGYKRRSLLAFAEDCTRSWTNQRNSSRLRAEYQRVVVDTSPGMNFEVS